LNSPSKISRKYIYICRFFQLLLLLELENYNVFQTALNDLIRYLKRKNRYHPFEKNLVEFLRTLSKTLGTQKEKEILDDFEIIMEQHGNEIYSTFRYLEFKV
jgi:hypothetical protein